MSWNGNAKYRMENNTVATYLLQESLSAATTPSIQSHGKMTSFPLQTLIRNPDNLIIFGMDSQQLIKMEMDTCRM